MDAPKNQSQLLQIIAEQDTQIRALKQAMMRMEQKMLLIHRLAERNQGNLRRQGDQTRQLIEVVRSLNSRLIE